MRAAGSRERPDLCGSELAHHRHVAGRVVAIDLEQAGGVVEAVEVGRTARTCVVNCFACLDRGGAFGEGVHLDRSGRPVADLLLSLIHISEPTRQAETSY